MKNFKQSKNESEKSKLEQIREKFPKSVSVLIVGTLAITAFFRGNTSHILLIIFWAACGIFQLRKYILSKKLRMKEPPWKNIMSAKRGRYPRNRQRKPYQRSLRYGRNHHVDLRLWYKMPGQKNGRRNGHGKNKIIR
jgi:hypothetical protein